MIKTKPRAYGSRGSGQRQGYFAQEDNDADNSGDKDKNTLFKRIKTRTRGQGRRTMIKTKSKIFCSRGQWQS